MSSIPLHRLEQVVDRFDEVEARMGAATEADEIVALSKEHAELKPVADKAKTLLATLDGIAEAEALVAGDDADMAE
ncbi:MAG: peptide chain release factor 1, partial [Pseudomonadota bacterium]